MSTRTTSLLFVILFTFVSISFVQGHGHEGHKCTHDDTPRPEPLFLDVEEDMSAVSDQEGRTLASYSNMRMAGYYDLLGSSSNSYREYIEKDLAPPVLAFFSASLKVKYPVSGLLKYSSSSLCGVSTPSSLRSGINADYMIMFDSELDTSSSWVAESYTCYLASGTKRPLIAKTVLNRDLLRDPKDDILLHEKNTYLVLHEMTHTLGFSSNLYRYFLDTNGKQRTGHTKSMKLNGGTSLVLDVAPLTQKLRNHFGCATLAGAYMENSGSSATANSHFERRQFGFEAMTSGLIYQQTYSEFTFALLEGTGWYVPDYDYADPHFFGVGQGCNFLTGSCTSSSFKFDEFCSGYSRGCTVQGRGGGVCNDDTRSDNCKFIHPNVDYDCDNTDAADYARLADLQSFGRNAYSKCFSGTLSGSSRSASTTSFCFKPTCHGAGTSTTLDIQVGKMTITCKKAGEVSVSGYYGTIDCPDPLTFCSTIGKAHCPRNCMGRGTCVNGKCSCKSGFTGKDCGLRA